MKKIQCIVLLAVVAAALIVGGCISPVNFSAPPRTVPIEAGKGQIRLTLGEPQGARTLFPDNWNTLTYRVTFTPKLPIPITEEVTKTFTSDHTENLAVGDWDVYVEALDGTTTVGEFLKENAAVTSGNTTEVEARIKPVTGTNGTLNWSIKYPVKTPALVNEAHVNYGILAPFTTADIDLINLTGAGAGTVTVNAGHWLATPSLPPGAYTFIAYLLNTESQKVAGRAESVHIYPGLTTILDWEFFEDSFNYRVQRTVTVDIVHSTNVTINSATLKTSAKIDGRDVFLPTTVTSATTGSTWTFTLEVDDEATELSGLSLEIVTSANNPDKLTYNGLSTFSPIVTTTMHLGSVNVYAAKATASPTVGGNVKINGSTPAATYQQDFLSGEAVTMTAVPNSPTYKTIDFTGLPGSGVTVTGENRSFTITSDAIVEIVFASLGGIHVTITKEGDMTFTGLTGPITLSQAAGDTLPITLDNYSTADWYVDGQKKASGKTFALNAADYRVGKHDLSILVVINGATYSTQETFTVTNP